MSEPNALYARIKISESAKDRFLRSEIVSMTAYSDWLKWLEDKQYYGSPITAEEMHSYMFSESTAGEYLGLSLFLGNSGI